MGATTRGGGGDGQGGWGRSPPSPPPPGSATDHDHDHLPAAVAAAPNAESLDPVLAQRGSLLVGRVGRPDNNKQELYLKGLGLQLEMCI